MASESISTFPVLFTSGGSLIVGRAYRRAGDLSERQPGVLVTGSWLTVKEQMAARYANALAQRGYTAITFDFTGFGQSEGGLCHAELPSRKIADIVAAASVASNLSSSGRAESATRVCVPPHSTRSPRLRMVRRSGPMPVSRAGSTTRRR